MLILSIIAALVVPACLFFGVTVYGRRKEDQIRSEIHALVSEFFISEGDQPTKAQVIMNAWADQISENVLLKVKQSLGGAEGAIARQEKQIEGEIIDAAIMQQNPILGMLTQMVPNLNKRIRKNPSAAAAVLSMLENSGLGGFGSNTGSGNGSVRKSFNFEV